MVIPTSGWQASIAELRSRNQVPAAQANATLLGSAQTEWDGSVVARTSMHDLLFTMLNDDYPWQAHALVKWNDHVFEFQLWRKGLLVTADRCRAENSLAVLGAFLHQLVAETPAH